MGGQIGLVLVRLSGRNASRPVRVEASMNEIAVALPDDARSELTTALERIRGRGGLVVRTSELLAGVLGSAAAQGLRRVRPPALVQERVRAVANAALQRAFDVAVLGLPASGVRARFEALGSRAAAAASGAVGGFAGMAGFLPDVAVTTLLIMRRIAAIAVEEGENTTDASARAACLEVFALGGSVAGGKKGEDEQPELGYWGARLVMQGRPLMALMSEAGAAYGLRVSQKLALQAVPLVGAVGGALVNGAFMAHYENLARGHFVVRRLERTYGAPVVRSAATAFAERDESMGDPV